MNDARTTTRERLAVGAIVAVALVAYAAPITGDLFGDEIPGTYTRATESPSILSVIDPSTTHPPLYYFLAKLSFVLVGQPWAIRLPALLFALATIVVLPFVARDLLGERFFLPAAALGAVSPFLLEFAAEGRSYTAIVFFALAALWSLVRFMRSDSPRDLTILLVLCAAGMMTHYFFALYVGFIAIAYLVQRRRLPPGQWKHVAVAAVLVGASLAALMLVPGPRFAENLQGGWRGSHFSAVNFLARLPVAISYGFATFHLPRLDPARNVDPSMLFDNWPVAVMIVVAFLGILVAVIGLLRQREQRDRVRLLVLGAGIPMALALLVGTLGFYLPREKHLAAIWGPVLLLQLLALERLIRTWPGRAVACCHLAVIGVSCFHFLAQPDEYSRRMNWTGLNETLERSIRSDDLVLYYKYELDFLSMNRLTVLQRQVRTHNLTVPEPGVPGLEAQARELDGRVRGAIFLVDYEEARNTVDPSSLIIRTLASTRVMTEQRFGRNLILFTFARRSPE